MTSWKPECYHSGSPYGSCESRKLFSSISLIFCSFKDGTRVLSHFICMQLFVTPWTAAHQAPLSTWFFGQEYWSGLPCPPPGGLPDPGVISTSPALAGVFLTASSTLEAQKDGIALAKSFTKTKFPLPIHSRPLIFLGRNSRMNEMSKYEERKKINTKIKRHK